MSGGTQYGAQVHFSPQALGLFFNIESNDYNGGISRIFISCVGPHRITGTGVRAILSRLNTYLGSTISAAQADAIQLLLPSIKISGTRVDFGCNTADKTTLINGLVTDLQSAGAVVSA